MKGAVKELLILWAKQLAALGVILGILMLVQQWDASDSQRIQIKWATRT